MQRTVSIPVNLPRERFLSLMELCAKIFNQHVDWALENKTYNKSRAHKDLYATLRIGYPTVPSALLQTVRDTAMEAVKATQFKRLPRKKPTSALRYDARTITLRGRQITLSCMGILTYSLEDLTGIRNQRRNKMNKWMSSWPFYQMEQFLTYKSEAFGKRVGYVDARYTSRKCNRCSHVNEANRKKSRFRCKSCGYQEHADLNAAYNIRDNYILSSTCGTEEQGSVNNPIATNSNVQLQAAWPCACGS